MRSLSVPCRMCKAIIEALVLYICNGMVSSVLQLAKTGNAPFECVSLSVCLCVCLSVCVSVCLSTSVDCQSQDTAVL